LAGVRLVCDDRVGDQPHAGRSFLPSSFFRLAARVRPCFPFQLQYKSDPSRAPLCLCCVVAGQRAPRRISILRLFLELLFPPPLGVVKSFFRNLDDDPQRHRRFSPTHMRDICSFLSKTRAIFPPATKTSVSLPPFQRSSPARSAPPALKFPFTVHPVSPILLVHSPPLSKSELWE